MGCKESNQTKQKQLLFSVVIQSNTDVPPLNDDSILFVEGRKVLGQVYKAFYAYLYIYLHNKCPNIRQF